MLVPEADDNLPFLLPHFDTHCLHMGAEHTAGGFTANSTRCPGAAFENNRDGQCYRRQ